MQKICFLLFLILKHTQSNQCFYQSCPVGDENRINLHFVPHTHLDTGWVRTFDQYYEDDVRYILNNVLQSLAKSPERKFTWTEVSFLSRWWSDPSTEDVNRDILKEFVRKGQFQFVSGGWSMNDEALVHYSAIIDDLTEGLKWLKSKFGDCSRPPVQWHIDQFGHSSEMASILSLMEFDAFILGRVDEVERIERRKDKMMEFMWKGNPVLDQSVMFTSILYKTYWMNDEWPCSWPCNDSPDLPLLFFNYTMQMSKTYQTNHILVPHGGDFAFGGESEQAFENLDHLIFNLNQLFGDRVLAYYSTPNCYIKSVHKSGNYWPFLENRDFFPYVTIDGNKLSSWVGYYTSRPVFKYLISVSNGILQASKQLLSLLNLNHHKYLIESLKSEVAIAMHHDAITGTSKKFVVEDYTERLNRALTIADHAFIISCSKILQFTYMNEPIPFFKVVHDSMNQTCCGLAEDGTIITIYNPLPYSYDYIMIILKLNFQNIAIKKLIGDNQEIIVQDLVTMRRDTYRESAFIATLPPLGTTSFLVKHKPEAASFYATGFKNRESQDVYDYYISNNFLTIFLDQKTGLIKTVQIKNGKNIELKQSFYSYRSGFNSGAYVFDIRSQKIEISHTTDYKIVKGPFVEEIHQIFNNWIEQTIRLYRDHDYVEFDWSVGPIEGFGQDIVAEYSSSLNSMDEFFTDSNGRQSILRKIIDRGNVTVAVPYNYYPVSSWIYIEDQENNLQMAILPDRPEGGSSSGSGAIELMVHRRGYTDDNKGLGEPLDEIGADGKGLVVRGKHYLILGDLDLSKSNMHRLSRQLVWKPVIMYHKDPEFNYRSLEFRGLKFDCPKNLHILTLEPFEDNILLRLENICEINDNDSCLITIELENLFTTFKIIECILTDLSGFDHLETLRRNRFKWSYLKKGQLREIDIIQPPFKISLKSMEIKTFIIKVVYSI